MKKSYILLALRILIGLMFVISGAEKLLQPYQNFLYVIQGYDVLPHFATQKLIALSFPWAELILGSFILLGLWTKPSLVGLWAIISGLIVTVGQAIARDLPLDECGCFGDLLHVPLPVIITMDIALWVIVAILLFFTNQTKFCSLDNYFLNK